MACGKLESVDSGRQRPEITDLLQRGLVNQKKSIQLVPDIFVARLVSELLQDFLVCLVMVVPASS